MSTTAEQTSKEITEFLMKDPNSLNILLAEDSTMFQAIVIDRIGNAIDANIASILAKLKIPFVGVLTSSREKQNKDLILSYKDNEKTVLTIEIRLAIDGEQAVELFKEHTEQGKPFNVVLMNYQMPKYVGSKAIEMIREYEKENALEPCVIIGWTSDKEYEELMKTKGANKFYRKSIHSEAIEKLVVEGIFDFPNVIETYDTEQREGPTP